MSLKERGTEGTGCHDQCLAEVPHLVPENPLSCLELGFDMISISLIQHP